MYLQTQIFPSSLFGLGTLCLVDHSRTLGSDACPLILHTVRAEAQVAPERTICKKKLGTENSKEKSPKVFNVSIIIFSTNESLDKKQKLC